MARIVPLCSSSKENSTYVGSKNSGVIIDAGCSYRALKSYLSFCDLDISAVKAVFITHEHSDHVKGLYQLTKYTNLPIYASKGTLLHLIKNNMVFNPDNLHEIRDEIIIEDNKIKCFATPHDSVQSCGYIIHTQDDKKIAVCTDLGEITNVVDEAVSGCDLVMLEANYDEKMLRSNLKYPFFLKRRISSSLGHLSNTASAAQIKKLAASGTKRFILGHLSQENNLPEIAAACVISALADMRVGKDYTLDVAPVYTVGKFCVV